ncbi:outer membrane protein assembly factor BamE [Paraburkholderia sp. SARCC-3016]|jgi:outer membrane protein assembly factor BamE (lipoprotein component of BamABCDE complex)|uniref:outer membrane protein assembly factor BamE n=1 Tax=Paraburkholderia sp. SARCC-3016 TaxID=3058611 RepID=UPI00280A42A7|nr:outer membrane protein assembly factor BamE [Paraburkholderia sp. SARCC-3016]MDQ7978253.1 outer membrane protein assembly factor BamE [Paraburkholderia sp. SARCC-3016]
MKIKSILATTVTLASVPGLSGCLFYPPPDGSFPDPDRAWTKDGSFPNMDNLRMVAPGQTKSQVDQLIGPPHFNEAVFHVREWNYLLHLRNGDQTMVCQFQIRFDSHSRVTAMRWRDQACADLVGAKTADGEDAPSPSAQ